ncbi:MAG: transglutaminase-like domain-containing protein [Microbacter sp.]
MKTRWFIMLFLVQSMGNTIFGQLISNPERLYDMQRMLTVQQELTARSVTPIWHFLQQPMTADEKQAMRFFYAYMPLSDIADYAPSFFFQNVKRTLEARSEMPWGKKIPEEVFLHFVLPLRVNNEHLDSFRLKMYPVLKARIQGLNMKDAALEINHWCHEKVTYRGTDDRTSSPLSTMKKSFGRCGEESTFTVTALRTVGIPARQVYTPRWAHTDDNHAWVEVWIDGKWHYMGACEPAPDLDMGWFTEPVKRIMLANTRAFGRYFGKDQIVVSDPRFAELNLTSNYAPVKNVIISVKNEQGQPVDSACVEFKLYNYAEFYPIATTFTNRQGKTQLALGLGDLLIWASKGDAFGYAKLAVPSTDSLTIYLKNKNLDGVIDHYYMVPPPAAKVISQVTSAQEAWNNHRLACEDSIRNAYMATFKDSLWAAGLAHRLHLSADTVIGLIQKSFGNWAQVETYLTQGVKIARKYVLALASQLSDKDLSDCSASVLTDQLRYAVRPEGREARISETLFIRYVLNPRIATENLSPWRSFLARKFGQNMAKKTRANIFTLIHWMSSFLTVNDEANLFSHSYISPEGVFLMRLTDHKSRDLFFVAACRTFGIPARLNPETQHPEYWKAGSWLPAPFSTKMPLKPVIGYLHLENGNNLLVPRYYQNFTLGVLHHGTYRALDFDEGQKVTDFAPKIPLDTGHYVLVTGNRFPDGSVMSSLTYFSVSKAQTVTETVQLQRENVVLSASGQLPLEQLSLQLLQNDSVKTLASMAQHHDLILALLEPDKEPTKHVLNDLSVYVPYFESWKGHVVLAVPQADVDQVKELKAYALPHQSVVGIDVSGNIAQAIATEYGQQVRDHLPCVLFLDAQGNILYFSSGYAIGVGEQLLRIKAKMDQSGR